MVVPVLVGEQVVLRPPRSADREERRGLGRSPEVVRGFGVALDAPARLTERDAVAWFSEISNDMNLWVIEVRGSFIGTVRLHSIESHDARAQLAIAIFDEHRLGKGHGTEAIGLVARHAFNDMGLHRIGLRVLASNGRAVRCYEKCGFRHEGRERESARVGDGWEDDLIMGLTRDDRAVSSSAALQRR